MVQAEQKRMSGNKVSGITAIIPTLNEEAFIDEAIESVSFADEIIIIDSLSTDRTLELARKHQVKIINREFDNFSNQKNFAIDHSTYDWIFVLDADERISARLKEEIRSAADQPNGYVGFFIYRNFYFKKKLVRFGGWQTDKVIRLFNKNHCRYDGKLVHEKIAYQGEIGYFQNRIEHFSFQEYRQYASKLDFYAKLQAFELSRENRSFHKGYKWFRPGLRFFVHYFLRFGILDGYKGYTLAKMHAKAVSKRYTLLESLKQREKKKAFVS